MPFQFTDGLTPEDIAAINARDEEIKQQIRAGETRLLELRDAGAPLEDIRAQQKQNADTREAWHQNHEPITGPLKKLQIPDANDPAQPAATFPRGSKIRDATLTV